MKYRTFVIQDPNHLNSDFYENFDEGYSLRKASILLTIVENLEQFKKFLEDIDEDNDDIDQKFSEAFRAEIHFTELHQFEAFFAMILAVFQDLPHWLFLKDYPTSEIREKVEAYIEGNIPKLTSGRASSEHDFLNWAIYAGFESDKEEHQKNWRKNLDDIAWMLRRMAKKYLDGLEEYNSFKHGLRFLTGPTYFKIFPTGQPEKGLQYSSDDSLRFLEVEKLSDEGVFVVKKVFKHFSPVESINHAEMIIFPEGSSANDLPFLSFTQF